MNPIWQTIEDDQKQIGTTRRLLSDHGVMELFERVPGLFESLGREVTAKAHLLRQDEGEAEKLDWDLILRIFLKQSALMQFLYAMGHVLRRHLSESHKHTRAMIENAGIAYLTKIRPDLYLGELYRNDEVDKYRKHTPSNVLFPQHPEPVDPKTEPIDCLRAQLGKDFKEASQMSHANLKTIAGRIQTELKLEDDSYDFTSHIKFHDDPGEDGKNTLISAAFLLVTTERVLRLFGLAFEIPDSVWHRRIDSFHRDFQPFIKERITTSRMT